jgi:hypothetical protein
MIWLLSHDRDQNPHSTNSSILQIIWICDSIYTIPWHSTTINHSQNHQHSNICWPLLQMWQQSHRHTPTVQLKIKQSKGKKQQSQQKNFPLISTVSSVQPRMYTHVVLFLTYKYSDFISDRTGGPQISGQNNMPIIYSQFVTAKNISSSRRQFWIPTPIRRHGNDVANLPVPSQGSEPMWPQKAPNQHWRWESVRQKSIFPLDHTVSSVTSCMHTYVVFLPWKTSDFIGDPIYGESYYSYVDSVVIFAKL